jgi:hypothetical protein
VSHPVHIERFGIPGKALLGADSHTAAAGSIGMLAIGAGGLEGALAMAGEPFYLKMPRVLGIRLVGELPDWAIQDPSYPRKDRWQCLGAPRSVIGSSHPRRADAARAEHGVMRRGRPARHAQPRPAVPSCRPGCTRRPRAR